MQRESADGPRGSGALQNLVRLSEHGDRACGLEVRRPCRRGFKHSGLMLAVPQRLTRSLPQSRGEPENNRELRND